MSTEIALPPFAAEEPPRARTTLGPSTGWQALNIAQVWQYRDLIFTLAGRDLKLRYKQTALGAIWVVFQPLMAAGIFSFVFGRVAKLPSDGLPYFVFSYAGLLGWNIFNSTLSKASGCLVGNSQLISKVYFPRLVLPISALISTLIDFGVALVMMAVLMAVYHVPPGFPLLLLPFWVFLSMIIALGAGLVTAAWAVSYRDVQYILPVLTQFLLYACPVAYAVSAVPASLQNYYFLNPLAAILQGFRWSLLGTDQPQLWSVVYAMLFSLASVLVGALIFKKMETRFADVI